MGLRLILNSFFLFFKMKCECGHERLNHFNQGEYREDGLEFPKGCKMVGCLCNKFKEVRE